MKLSSHNHGYSLCNSRGVYCHKNNSPILKFFVLPESVNICYGFIRLIGELKIFLVKKRSSGYKVTESMKKLEPLMVNFSFFPNHNNPPPPPPLQSPRFKKFGEIRAQLSQNWDNRSQSRLSKINPDQTRLEMEFKEFKPQCKSAKIRQNPV